MKEFFILSAVALGGIDATISAGVKIMTQQQIMRQQKHAQRSGTTAQTAPAAPLSGTKTPNKETLQTFAKTDAELELTECKDANDMFKRLGI